MENVAENVFECRMIVKLETKSLVQMLKAINKRYKIPLLNKIVLFWMFLLVAVHTLLAIATFYTNEFSYWSIVVIGLCFLLTLGFYNVTKIRIFASFFHLLDKFDKHKKKYEYEIVFNEEGIIVSYEGEKQKLRWKQVECVCSTKNCWLLMPSPILLSKEWFTPEQNAFIEDMCRSAIHKKKIKMIY